MKIPNQQTGSKMRPKSPDSKNSQYGGTILGFILGLGAGLAIAFVVAFYLNKNTPQERPGMRAPSLPLTIKPSEGGAPAATEQVDLNKLLQGRSPAPSSSDPIGDLVSGKKSADKPADLTPASTTKSDSIYFLQVGAFAKRSEADAQKANLAIQGIQAQLSEVASEGNTLWRVRIGPYNSVDESNAVRDKLSGMGIKPTLIKSSKS